MVNFLFTNSNAYTALRLSVYFIFVYNFFFRFLYVSLKSSVIEILGWVFFIKQFLFEYDELRKTLSFPLLNLVCHIRSLNLK